MAAVRPRLHTVKKLLRTRKPQRSFCKVAVLGGGITGLTTAYRLAEDPSTKVTLYEKSGRLGGWLQSERVEVDGGSVLFEWGPRTLRASGEQALPTLELLHDLGLQDRVLHTNKNSPAAQDRYIYYPDRLVRMPSPTKGLLDVLIQCFREPLVRDMVRGFLKEPFQPRLQHLASESIEEFVTRRFGPKVAANIVSAVYHGIYAGDISQLSAPTILPSLLSWELQRKSVSVQLLFGSKPPYTEADVVEYRRILTGEKGPEQQEALEKSVQGTSVITLRSGLEDITQSLKQKLSSASNVDVKYNACLEKLAPNIDPRDPNVRVDLAGVPGATYDYVVSTIPSMDLANIIYSPPNLEIPTSVYLKENAYAVNVMVVNLYYNEPNIVPIPGFGYLIPRSVPASQNPELGLGVIFASQTSVGQDTAPGTKLTVMLGGHWWDSWKKTDLPDERSGIEMAKSLLRRHLHITAEPAVAKARLQHSAIPQYTTGHIERMQSLDKALEGSYNSRLQVAGAWYTGVSVNDCIRSARLSAASVLAGTARWHGLEKYLRPVHTLGT